MSGPKVVRVRTREERAAECLVQIDGLRASIEQCEAFARHHECADTNSAQRRAALVLDLTRKLDAGAFDAVRRACEDEQVAVNFDREQLEREVLERAASGVVRKRRTQHLAQALAQRIEAQGQTVPPELVLARNLASSDAGIDQAERIVSKLLASQVASATGDETHNPTDAQRQLADSLTTGDATQSLAEWATRRATETSDDSNDRLQRLIAEVEVLDATEAGRPLLARANAVRHESDGHLRAMKTDSLLLEWAKRRRSISAESQLALRVRKVVMALGRLEDGRAKAIGLRLAVKGVGTSETEVAVAEAEAYLAEQARMAAAVQRRQAVLRGLASIGYEVGAELVTASPAGGRLVIRKPDRPSYGVEVLAPEGANRLQVKVVAIAGSGISRDPVRNRDAETLWCSDFSRLQELLRRDGTELVVEKALGVGAVPLSEVSLGERGEATIEIVTRERKRTI